MAENKHMTACSGAHEGASAAQQARATIAICATSSTLARGVAVLAPGVAALVCILTAAVGVTDIARAESANAPAAQVARRADRDAAETPAPASSPAATEKRLHQNAEDRLQGEARAARKGDKKAMLKNPLKGISVFDSVDKGFATDFFPTEVESVTEVKNEEVSASAKVAPSDFDARAKSEGPAQPAEKGESAKTGGEQGDTAALAPKSEADEQDALVASLIGKPRTKKGPVFFGKFKPGDAVPPDQDPGIRIDPEAPTPFIMMALAEMNGDHELAAKYADQWVRYRQNLFFEVRKLTNLIGEALIRNQQLDEDDWQGVPVIIDYELAKARNEMGSVFKPTHEQAMKQIVPDQKGEAAVYYFFTLNCSYCRFMAPDVERLFRALKSDPKVKMAALTLGPLPKDWLAEYRSYTGLTAPVFNGQRIAKQLGVGAPPALVVVSPNGKKAYLKTGQQSFARMYEFVRTVQGLPPTLSPEVQQIAKMKVGEVENTALNLPRNLEEWVRPEDLQRIEARRQKHRDQPVVASRQKERAPEVPRKVDIKELKF